VIVPASHDIGSLDQDATGSSEKFFKLEHHQSFQNMEALKNEISKNQFPEIIVFVHRTETNQNYYRQNSQYYFICHIGGL
jgi:hypothetical protein